MMSFSYEEAAGNCGDRDDDGAESTDIYFDEDSQALFVDIQYAEAGNRDGTRAIINRNQARGYSTEPVNAAERRSLIRTISIYRKVQFNRRFPRTSRRE